MPFTPDPPDHHHTNRTLGGIADPWVLVAAGRTAGPWSFGARAGTSLPLGPTVENPFALGDLGLPHEHVQHGSGTLQPIVSLGVGRRLGAWAATAIGFVRFGAGTNGHGYRPGHQWLGQAFASAGLGVPGATFSLGPSLHHETAETWDGRREEEGNLGRTDLYAEARAAWIPPGWRTGLGGELRVPLWSESTGEQFDVPVSFRLSLSRTIGGPTP